MMRRSETDRKRECRYCVGWASSTERSRLGVMPCFVRLKGIADNGWSFG